MTDVSRREEAWVHSIASSRLLLQYSSQSATLAAMAGMMAAKMKKQEDKEKQLSLFGAPMLNWRTRISGGGLIKKLAGSYIPQIPVIDLYIHIYIYIWQYLMGSLGLLCSGGSEQC